MAIITEQMNKYK